MNLPETKFTFRRPSAVATLLLLAAGSVTQAATLGWWRFEGDPATTYLEDSSGNGHTLSTVGVAPVQITRPATGNASAFSDPIPATGASNDSASEGSGTGNFSVADPFSYTNFTVEAFINRPVTAAGTQYFVSQWNAAGGQRAFAFGLAGSNDVGANVGSANDLFFALSETGATPTLFFSGFDILAGTDYYVAASFDLADQATGLKFFIQDLTNGGALQTIALSHNFTTLTDSTANFEISSYNANTNRYVGIIDEVRFSDASLDASGLLISVPEPSVWMLLAVGGIAFFGLRRAAARIQP